MDRIQEAKEYVSKAQEKGSELFAEIAIAEALIAIAEKLDDLAGLAGNNREALRVVCYKPEI